MIINLIQKSFHHPTYGMQTKFRRLVSKPAVTKDGSLTSSQSVFEDFDFVDYSSQFVSSDFDIQSLLSVGAYDMLKPTFVSSMSNMDFADKFQNLQLPKDE